MTQTIDELTGSLRALCGLMDKCIERSMDEADVGHHNADEVLCTAIELLDHPLATDLVQKFKTVQKWYS